MGLRGPDQRVQGCVGAASELAAQEDAKHPAPPPGREMKISIEPDERALLGVRQRHAFVVDDAEGQVNHQFEPPLLRVHVAHVDPHRPLATERSRQQPDHLAGLDRSEWIG